MYQASVHGRDKAVLPLPKDYATPNMSLLAVNKTIRTEARPIVYQQNTFVLPNAFYAVKFFMKALPSPAEKLWLKSVELEWCDEDMSVSTKNKFANNMMLDQPQALFYSYRHNEDHVRSSVLDWTNMQHNNWKNHLGHVIWPTKLYPLLESTNLDQITVHINNSLCPMGCCCMQQMAIVCFRKGFANGMVKQFNLCGLDTIHELLPNRDGADEDDGHAWYHDIYERLSNDGDVIAAVRYIQYWSELRQGTIGLRRPKGLAQFERVCAWRTMQ